MGTATKAARRAAEPRQNGNGGQDQSALAEAMAHEDQIARDAAAIWAEHGSKVLTPGLFLKLRPLLRRAIPPGYIDHVGEKPGKPYESTGVKSVQVQMDRLDNVLGPHNWGYSRTFTDDGHLCEVVAWVGESREEALFERDSYGGVKQGSTKGNIFKGSFTNAAKPALARLGPGWEVYVGAGDFDPDTDRASAEVQGQEPKGGEKDPNRPLSGAAVEKLRDAIEAKGIPASEVAMKLRAFGVEADEGLTAEQGMAFWSWVNDWEAKS